MCSRSSQYQQATWKLLRKTLEKLMLIMCLNNSSSFFLLNLLRCQLISRFGFAKFHSNHRCNWDKFSDAWNHPSRQQKTLVSWNPCSRNFDSIDIVIVFPCFIVEEKEKNEMKLSWMYAIHVTIKWVTNTIQLCLFSPFFRKIFIFFLIN